MFPSPPEAPSWPHGPPSLPSAVRSSSLSRPDRQRGWPSSVLRILPLDLKQMFVCLADAGGCVKAERRLTPPCLLGA